MVMYQEKLKCEGPRMWRWGDVCKKKWPWEREWSDWVKKWMGLLGKKVS